jgi:hypothetical protein
MVREALGIRQPVEGVGVVQTAQAVRPRLCPRMMIRPVLVSLQPARIYCLTARLHCLHFHCSSTQIHWMIKEV